MLLKFFLLDKFDRQARQRCNFSSSFKREEKITSLSSLPVELIKEKKFDEHIREKKEREIMFQKETVVSQ